MRGTAADALSTPARFDATISALSMTRASTSMATGLALLVSSIVTPGCSLSTVEQTACVDDTQCANFDSRSTCGDDGYCVVPAAGSCNATADCRRSIGFGSICDDGKCVDAAPVPRCADRAFPADLFSDLESHRDRLVVGMLMDHNVAAHKERENAVELAVSQINEQRGIDGRLLGVIFCDVHDATTGSYDDALERPDAAVANARWLVDTLDLPAIIGPASSGDATRVYLEVVRDADGRCLEMTPSGTSPSLTNLDTVEASDASPGLLWRSAPSATQQGEIVAMHMAERTDVDVKNVAIVHEEAAFGEAVAEAFAKLWEGEPGASFNVFSYAAGDTGDLEQQVGTLGDRLNEFHAVFVLGQVDEMGVFMRTATADARYPDDIPLYFGDTGANREIFKDITDNRLFDNVFAATVDLPNTFVNTSFNDAFMERYKTDPRESSFTANAYDALWLVALGAAWATYHGEGEPLPGGLHEVDGVNIARGLRRTVDPDPQDPENKEITEITFVRTAWPTGLAQLMAGNTIDVTGASGDHDWNLLDEEAPGPTALLETDGDGVQTIVKQLP